MRLQQLSSRFFVATMSLALVVTAAPLAAREPTTAIPAVQAQHIPPAAELQQLAMMGATLANEGVNPKTGKRLLDREYVPKLLSIMLTAGLSLFLAPQQART